MVDKKIDYVDIVRCIRKYESCAYNNIGSINLIEDLRLSKNVHETAHSRLLYKFLLIKGNDENPYPLLREFLKIIGCPWKDEKFDDVFIKPEKEHIDVLITFGRYAIIIENKVNRAKDQDGQIKTYYEKLKDENFTDENIDENFMDENIYVLYLTRMASDLDPSESSLPEDLKNHLGKRYKKISYEKEIRDWLRNVVRKYREWFKTMKQKDEQMCQNNYSALVQYSFFLNDMFEGNTEEIGIMIKNIKEALGIGEETDSFAEIKPYIEPAKDFASKLENYFVSVVLQQLQEYPDPVECREKDKQKVEFAILYNNQYYLGIANVDPLEDGGYWFAIGKEKERSCAISWEHRDKINLDNETAIKEKIENAFEKELGVKKANDDDDDDNKDADVFHVYSDSNPYPYWKYCSSIEKLIKEIKKFVNYVNSESETN